MIHWANIEYQNPIIFSAAKGNEARLKTHSKIEDEASMPILTSNDVTCHEYLPTCRHNRIYASCWRCSGCSSQRKVSPWIEAKAGVQGYCYTEVYEVQLKNNDHHCRRPAISWYVANEEARQYVAEPVWRGRKMCGGRQQLYLNLPTVQENKIMVGTKHWVVLNWFAILMINLFSLFAWCHYT